ncbi:MAG TPA: type IV toxin-antitoxin system AbiEi family antitoxin domain-containing protein [Acidimicrobiales bacterium]|nr:type IV toxin-antitoxin system AbiEi family antitoxin domain-containing protein [Acidimicrobiales bacterium]
MGEGDRQARRRRMSNVARTQGGYFTAAQALDAGYPYQAQTYHVAQGNWQRIDRGLFRLPEWPVTEHEDLIRWSQWSRGRAVVSHATALSVHDLGDLNPAQVHLTVPRGFRKRAEGVVLHRGEVPEADTQQWEGFRITAPLRSVLDIANGDLDLDQLATVVAEALERGLFTRRMLLARADEFGDRAALRIERTLARAS